MAQRESLWNGTAGPTDYRHGVRRTVLGQHSHLAQRLDGGTACCRIRLIHVGRSAGGLVSAAVAFIVNGPSLRAAFPKAR